LSSSGTAAWHHSHYHWTIVFWWFALLSDTRAPYFLVFLFFVFFSQIPSDLLLRKDSSQALSDLHSQASFFLIKLQSKDPSTSSDPCCFDSRNHLLVQLSLHEGFFLPPLLPTQAGYHKTDTKR
jgi:hypothetical protein